MRSIRARRAGADCRAARKLTYANVASTLALLLVLAGGTAYAANHYLITKTSQIKPSVLKDLRGRAGSSGAPGALGGAFGSAVATGQSITTSEPANSDTGWLVAMSNSSASNEHFTAYAICAAVS